LRAAGPLPHHRRHRPPRCVRFAKEDLPVRALIRILLVLALVGAGVYFAAARRHGKKLDYDGSDLYYKSPVTEEEAKKLGDFLVKSGVFDKEKPKSAQLIKEGSVYHVRFIIEDGKHDDPMLAFAMMLMSAGMKTEVFGDKRFEIQLCKDDFEVVKTLPGAGSVTGGDAPKEPPKG
jgi:hypothetical protein